MDPQTLPAEALALYQAVKKQYTVRFEPLTIQDHRLNILKITDLEQLLDGKDPLANVSEFPFWIRLWEAAIVLANFIASQPPKPGATLLELGAGLGVSGLAGAAAGYKTTLTDYEQIILDFEKVNAAASKLDSVNVEMLDWLAPGSLERYDVILGAEILFREEFFTPLLDILRQTIKPDGVIYLAHDARRKSLLPFLEMAKKEYRISASKRRLRSLEEDKTIILNRLVPLG